MGLKEPLQRRRRITDKEDEMPSSLWRRLQAADSERAADEQETTATRRNEAHLTNCQDDTPY